MTAFGVQPRMAGSKFFPTQRVAVVPRCRIPRAPIAWSEAFFPFPSLHISYPEDVFIAAEEFVDRVCAHHGITRAELVGEGRTSLYVGARREVAQELTNRGWSTPQIGALLNRDHTSIVYMLGRGKRNAKRRAARAKGVVAVEAVST